MLFCKCKEESIKKLRQWQPYAQDNLNLRAPIWALSEGALMRANNEGEGRGQQLLLFVLARLGRGARSLLYFEPEQQQALLVSCNELEKHNYQIENIGP